MKEASSRNLGVCFTLQLNVTLFPSKVSKYQAPASKQVSHQLKYFLTCNDTLVLIWQQFPLKKIDVQVIQLK
jgi:hypothetical protein